MTPEALLRELLDLAQAAQLTVRSIRGAGEGAVEPGAASGVCSVRGEVWVVLSASDPVADQLAVLSGALREHRAEFLEGRYLPPAVRESLEG